MDPRSAVLIVDAEEESRTTLERALESLDCDLLATNSGEEALELLADHQVALVLIALELPGIDGLAVVKKIERERPTVRVVALTTRVSVDVIDECVRHGVLEVLRKPVSYRRVLSLVQDVLAREQRGGPSSGG